jgi:phage portal protein BeeE
MATDSLVVSKTILGPDGRPVELPAPRSDADGEAVLRAYTTYATSIAGLRLPSFQRAREPFNNNAWVYAAAVATATNAAQSPFVVYRETEGQQALRQRSLVQKGLWQGTFPSGTRRRAIQRHVTHPVRMIGIVPKGLEPDLESELNGVFLRPNALMDGRQLWFLTVIWQVLRGEAFWLLLDEAGEPTPWGSGRVANAWPVAPDYVHEIVDGGALVGWQVGSPHGMQGQGSFPVAFDELLHFYDPDPDYPIRGLSPLSAAASEIYMDAAAARNNINLINQGGAPVGVLIHDGAPNVKPFKNKDEEEEFRIKFSQRHGGGVDRQKSIALLTGGWRYQQLGLAPKDMQFIEQRSWGRDEVLACLNTPKTILSVTDTVNYATDLSQKRAFWDHNILPRQAGQESVLDSTLFYSEDDSVVGMFDNSRVDALKVGVSDKIASMNGCVGPGLHMPPTVAAAVVGLSLPSYDGDDLCFIPSGLTTVDDAMDGPPRPDQGAMSLSPAAPQGPPVDPATGLPIDPQTGQPIDPLQPQGPSQDGQDGSPDDRDPSGTPEDGDQDQGQGSSKERSFGMVDTGLRRRYNGNGYKASRLHTAHTSWERLYQSLIAPSHDSYRRLWRRVVARHCLTDDARAAAIAVYAAHVRRLGLDPDDPDVAAVIERRAAAMHDLADSASKAASRVTWRSLTAAASITDVAAARAALSGRSVSDRFAVSEAVGTACEAREASFCRDGLSKRLWLAAPGCVRHRALAEAGLRPAGFNWLELLEDDDGLDPTATLEYPGDLRAPAEDVTGCRCMHEGVA